MRIAFGIWDPPLQKLCNACPQLFDALATALVRSLYKLPVETVLTNSPTDYSDNDYDDAEKQATVLWLRHILSSTEWNGVRSRKSKFGTSEDDLQWDLMMRCINHPLPSTLRFAETLLSFSHDSVRQYWTQFYLAARGPRWKWRREGRDVVGEDEESEKEVDKAAGAGRRKRPLEDVEDQEGPGEEEDPAGEAVKHRKVEIVQTTEWAVPIGEVPVTRTLSISSLEGYLSAGRRKASHDG
jgi:hypothetical protein